MSETDGDLLDAEANALVDRYNDAKPSYSPELEWFGMSTIRGAEQHTFVFEAGGYIDPDGLEALRDCGRQVRYIEGYEYGGDVSVQIEIRVRGEVPADD